MAIHRYLNQPGLGGNFPTWWLIKAMTDAGWTIPLSGSGTSGLYAAGNVFDLAQVPKRNSQRGANGVGVGSEAWGHAYCWAVLEDPSGNRQIILQRDSANSDTTDDDWFLGYSAAGTFGAGQTAGVDWDATTTPQAADQVNLWGSRTAWNNIFADGNTSNLTHVAADDVPSPSGEYGVFLIEMTANRKQNAIFLIDDIRDAVPNHPHPLVLDADSTDNIISWGSYGGGSVPKYGTWWTDYGGGGEKWIGVAPCNLRYGSTVVYPYQAGLGIDNVERAFPFIWGFADLDGYVGRSRWLHWAGCRRQYPSLDSTKRYLYVTDGMIRDLLDGSTIPLSV